MPDRVAVIGAGVIGTSVAYSCAQAGRAVTLIDRPDKDWGEVRRALRRQQRLTRLTAAAAPAVDLDRIACSAELADAADAGLVIENVVEDRDVKRAVHARLRELGVTGAVIAVNTSAIPIAELAAEAADPALVVGVHFMNPVPAIDTVEVVRTPATSAATLAAIEDFLGTLGKRGVVVNDAPGFVINRILMVMVNQAAQLVDEGVASPHEIDQLFKGCLGHEMGPLRTADLIGLDTVVRTLEVLHEARPEPLFAPADRLRELVGSGCLGMKAGRGFYGYGGGSRDA